MFCVDSQLSINFDIISIYYVYLLSKNGQIVICMSSIDDCIDDSQKSFIQFILKRK